MKSPLHFIDGQLGIVAPAITEETVAREVDAATEAILSAAREHGITFDGKPEDPPGDRYVMRLGSNAAKELLVFWVPRSHLIRSLMTSAQRPVPPVPPHLFCEDDGSAR